MYKIVYLKCKMEIKGIANNLFGKEKEVSIIKYYEMNPILVEEMKVDERIEKWFEDIEKELIENAEKGYRFFCDSTGRIALFKSINSVKSISNHYVPKVVDVDKVSYEELRKIANVRELMKIEDYYKKLI